MKMSREQATPYTLYFLLVGDSTYQESLIKELLQRSSSYTRPVRNVEDPVQVKFGIELLQIKNVVSIFYVSKCCLRSNSI